MSKGGGEAVHKEAEICGQVVTSCLLSLILYDSNSPFPQTHHKALGMFGAALLPCASTVKVQR